MKNKTFRIEERAEVLRVYEVTAEDEDRAAGMIYGAAVDPVSVEDIESSMHVSRINSEDCVRREGKSDTFKQPKDVDDFIAIWGMMDSVVRSVKKGTALSTWKRESVPVDVDGKSFTIRSAGRLTQLRYAHIVANRYWYREFFARDMQNWRRLYAVFASVISME